jgi:hypothetical protein
MYNIIEKALCVKSTTKQNYIFFFLNDITENSIAFSDHIDIQII